MGNLISVDGRGLWRLSCAFPKEEALPDETAARALVRRAAVLDTDVAIRAILPWVRREEVADRYRCGRVLLAGDAAHVM